MLARQDMILFYRVTRAHNWARTWRTGHLDAQDIIMASAVDQSSDVTEAECFTSVLKVVSRT